MLLKEHAQGNKNSGKFQIDDSEARIVRAPQNLQKKIGESLREADFGGCNSGTKSNRSRPHY